MMKVTHQFFFQSYYQKINYIRMLMDQKKLFPCLINFSGYIYNDFQFEYEEGALPQNGCSVTLNGQFWYIGGSGRPEKDGHPYRQVRMHLFDFKQVKRRGRPRRGLILTSI